MPSFDLPPEVRGDTDGDYVSLCYAILARQQIELTLNRFLGTFGFSPPRNFPMASRWAVAAALAGTRDRVSADLVLRVETAWNLLSDACHLSDRADVPSLNDLEAIVAAASSEEAFKGVGAPSAKTAVPNGAQR